MDLNPYGHVPPAHRIGPIFTYDDPALAHSRASFKLQQWRQGLNTDPSVGSAFWWPSLVMICGVAELTFGAAIWWHTGAPQPMLFTGPLGLYLLVVSWRTSARSRARTPVDCMREFAHCIQRGDMGRAWLLVAPVDRDNYTRAAPSISEHDPVSVKRFAFDSRAGFAAYWRSARALGPASRLKIVVGGRFTMVGHGMALVSVEVNVQKSLRVQSEKRTIDVRKLLLLHGNEWRVFDGEVASAADLDQQWIHQLLVAQPLNTAAAIP